MKLGLRAAALAATFLLSATPALDAQQARRISGSHDNSNHISHVLLISIDGMHALDFENCSRGIATVNSGGPYCPNLAALALNGVNYVSASTSKPSDSFPGLTALVTGGSPVSTGAYYDVSYDRSLSPPAKTTPYGIAGGSCPQQVGTQVGFDEEIDIDLTRLDAGGGINPDYLPRDPKNNCAPVYPHSFIRVNTIFEAVKDAGGYTAWSDKHQSYELTKGKSGQGVDDFFSPEINSNVVGIPGIKTPAGVDCSTVQDSSQTGAWTDSFANIQCYDSLKVQAIVNEIDGRTHDGSQKAPIPNLFGMNFQAVSVGQKLVEKNVATGGYMDAIGTPSSELLGEIEFVDASIGRMITELKNRHAFSSTLIVVTAKHGQSPIDPARVLRITGDTKSNPKALAPSDILGGVGGTTVAQADEDDISLLWLNNDQNPSTIATAVATLEANAANGGFNGGEIYYGPALDLLYPDPSVDPRTPDIVIQTNVGVIYTGGQKKVAEHGGFAHDDTNVMMLVSNPMLPQGTIASPVETAQVAPTILQALSINPLLLGAVRNEGTQTLPGLVFSGSHGY